MLFRSPHLALRDGQWRTIFGWQDLWRHPFPGIGPRWMANCDVPDLAVFPARHADLATVRFSAGVELTLMHLGLWAMSWLVRARLLPRPEALARPLLAVKRRLSGFGSDAGGMFVTMEGSDHDARPLRLVWHVIARSNHGPFIPPAPAALLAAPLARGAVADRGARPCLGLVPLADIEALLTPLDIAFTLSEVADNVVV